jgi:uncharacterized protein YodC (DUF2158 family)
MAKQWKPGETVMLASGGPKMTVRKQGQAEITNKEIVQCQWFDKDGHLQLADFDPDTLVASS